MRLYRKQGTSVCSFRIVFLVAMLTKFTRILSTDSDAQVCIKQPGP